MENYGGNILKVHSLNEEGEKKLCFEPYNYSIHLVTNGKIKILGLKSFTIFILKTDPKVKISSNMFSDLLNINMTVQVEDNKEPFLLEVRNGSSIILISGSKKRALSEQKGIYINKKNNLYKVNKPWGHELWINGEHELYAFKEIFIKAGTKTSLQYHKLKKETNLLVKGKALLHYKSSENVLNSDVTENDISTVELSEISSVDVSPQILHRIEAVTDIVLYETSSPHLNDVVRISDDSKRPDGRIDEEHEDQ